MSVPFLYKKEKQYDASSTNRNLPLVFFFKGLTQTLGFSVPDTISPQLSTG